MTPTFNKIFAWIILVAGLGIICWAILSSYNFFTAKEPFPQIFEIEEEKEISPGSKEGISIPSTQKELQQQAQEQVQEQFMGEFKKMLPKNTIPGLLNMTCWLAFASFLVFAGAQISGLGIRLLKSSCNS
ncbi:MAG: hypothetical protein COX88_00970 [Candidatus Nealsonbacteria bacterium CG_4_10_14_0_2_um_filter_35_20]|nr:MAG: hypothetical protein COZ88_00350 [Candidatus Nealsonbacteria bacterium CG_4_8_14_3_um_filter_34_13]PIZ89966.1 MAG: hypothetical protein COX88_00970 [Candidatus Nealsonbacteria bacterium CG_4_10_14_0_2_um_filter_35_20]